jgi:hypothetical protein
MTSASAGMAPARRPGRPAARDRALWPKEHGAYGQIAFPLVTALALGRPSLASGSLALGASAAFVAHEPLLVALGLRGARARREHGARATQLALGCGALALACGACGWWLAGMSVVLASIPPLLLVAALLPLVVKGLERTTAGEVLAGAALSAAALPVAAAGGVSLALGAHVWAAWVVAFTASTSAVRLVIGRHKTGARDRSLVALSAAATIAAGALSVCSPVGLAAFPMVVAGWGLVARPPHPKDLRRVGWTLVACSSATAIVAITAGRLA